MAGGFLEVILDDGFFTSGAHNSRAKAYQSATADNGRRCPAERSCCKAAANHAHPESRIAYIADLARFPVRLADLLGQFLRLRGKISLDLVLNFLHLDNSLRRV